MQPSQLEGLEIIFTLEIQLVESPMMIKCQDCGLFGSVILFFVEGLDMAQSAQYD